MANFLPDYKKVADLHRETGTNSMSYFEMSYGERRSKELPKKLDLYVYEDMHTWLRHKPSMNPPHFRDLLNPNDGNFRTAPIAQEDFCSGETSGEEEAFNAYASVAAFDAAADAISDSDAVPEEVEVSVGAKQPVPRDFTTICLRSPHLGCRPQ
jgi:hypothetical protein